MCGLVGNEIQSRKLFVGRRILREEYLVIGELDAPRVLHAAKLVARQHHETILFEGVGDARVLLHPAQ